MLRDGTGAAPRLVRVGSDAVSACHDGTLAVSAGGGRIDVYAAP